VSVKKTAEEFFAPADIRPNGDRPWDIEVHDERFYRRVLTQGTLGFGESYMDGWWDSLQLDECVARLNKSGVRERAAMSWGTKLRIGLEMLLNEGRRSNAFTIGKRHYDIGNDLFSRMLGERMVYSCGYWSGNPPATTLDAAQEAKLELICRKLELKAGMRLLDIGCGWGGLAKFAAERYGVSVVGVTVSEQQAALATERCKGLPVEILLQDYRDFAAQYSLSQVEGLRLCSANNNTKPKFDRIVSIGMFEHVGYKNYRAFMDVARRCLKEDGLFLLHTIGGNVSVRTMDPWTKKYIFPVGMIPSIKQIGRATEGLFVMEDWHNFSADYDKTLMQWFSNFHRHWPEIKEKYGDRFYRMWKFYLLASAGSFRSRNAQLWQIVLSPTGVPGGYHSIR